MSKKQQEKLREEFVNAFGFIRKERPQSKQIINQDTIADWWFSKIEAREKEIVEKIEKEPSYLVEMKFYEGWDGPVEILKTELILEKQR